MHGLFRQTSRRYLATIKGQKATFALKKALLTFVESIRSASNSYRGISHSANIFILSVPLLAIATRLFLHIIIFVNHSIKKRICLYFHFSK